MNMPLRFLKFMLLSWSEVIHMWQTENITAKEEAFESIPAGKWKVEAGAGGYISRAVQRTVCCWETSLLLQITISVRKKNRRDHAAALSRGNLFFNFKKYNETNQGTKSKWLLISVLAISQVAVWSLLQLCQQHNEPQNVCQTIVEELLFQISQVKN